MDPMMVAGIACVALLAMIAVRVPVAIALAASGLLGVILLETSASPSAIVQTTPFSTTARFSWTVVPMFILMGAFATASGLVSSLFRIANQMFKRIPGGIGLAAVAACAGFAAVSGSSVATAASIGPIAGKEMHRAGYRASFAAGLVASAGTLGVLIPPSIILVIYGITTGESIGMLLLAGIVPGVISALVIGAFVVALRITRPRAVMTEEYLRAQLKGVAYVPSSSSVRTARDGIDDLPAEAAVVASAADGPQIQHTAFGATLRLVVLFTLVMGGIYGGIVTATEAAALGALGAFIIALVDLAPYGPRAAWDMVRAASREAAATTGMLFLIVVGASIFTYFFVLAGVPGTVSSWVLGFDLAPMAVVAVILLIMIPLGMFLEPTSIILIVVPLAYPIVVMELGFSGIWFGILVVKMIEIGLITPPIGLNVFVVSGVMKGLVTTTQAFKGVTWFVIVDLALVTLFFSFPGLIMTWLPDTLL